MVIIEDTRQKPDKTDYISHQLTELGCEVIRSKLLVGDYIISNASYVSVDTKQDMNEVENNLTSQHKRFRNECELAQKCGINLVILIQDDAIKTLDDVIKWYNPRKRYSKTAVSGKQLHKIMVTMSKKYGVQWSFCTKDEVGEKILEELTKHY